MRMLIAAVCGLLLAVSAQAQDKKKEPSEAQKAQLKKVIEVYASAFEPALRDARLARAADDFDVVRFAWAGATERGKPHYYRIQGAKFLVEYDASQDGGNHIHTVWRDFDGDWGDDLLAGHYERSDHHDDH